MAGLAREFLEIEGTQAAQIALTEIYSDQRDQERIRRTLNFNVFDLEIDYVASTVEIQEILTPCREEVIPLDEFLDLIQSSA